jgi:hypothetical protein
MKHSFEKKTRALRNFSWKIRVGCTNECRFNWVFMKLPNNIKKQKMKAKLPL